MAEPCSFPPLENPGLFLYTGHTGQFGVDDLEHDFSDFLNIPADLPSAAISPPLTLSSFHNDLFIDVDFASLPAEPHHEPTPQAGVVQSVNPQEVERTHTMTVMPASHLMKKSRGRKVPTNIPTGSRDGGPSIGQRDDKDRRHVCGYCGGQFKRGEHLKRHVRSIHTDERPWRCTFAGCRREFSRRDNLNQHLRMHQSNPESKTAEGQAKKERK